MEQLGGQDARFLYAETPRLPMHTLKVAVLDTEHVPGGYSFARLREEVAARLHLLVPFRRRLQMIPMGLAHPLWVDDADFDLDQHLVLRRAADPGGSAQLDAIVSEIAGRLLPRDRPLWELTVVEGLAGGRVAVVAKIHHAMADGKAAVDLLMQVMETEPTPVALPPAPPWQPEPAPSATRVALVVLESWLGLAKRLPALVDRSIRGLARRFRLRRHRAVRTPRPILDAPRTPFNRSLTSRRAFSTLDLRLDEVRLVRKAFGVKVNDVLLAVVGGALRAYLVQLGCLPGRPLVAGVPVGASLGDSTRLWGNAVDNLYATLATDTDDCVERLRRIAAVSTESKLERAALGSDVVVEWQGYTPLPVFAGLVRGFAGSRLANRVPPPINCIVSNVAGPGEDLFVAGARLDAIYSVGPILEAIGLNVTVWSYVDRLHVSMLCCSDLGPDLHELGRELSKAHRELVERAMSGSESEASRADAGRTRSPRTR